MPKENSKAGGSRAGAGRPNTKERITCYVPIKIAEKLKLMENKSDFISQVLINHFTKEDSK